MEFATIRFTAISTRAIRVLLDGSIEKCFVSDHRFFCLRGFMKSGTNWLGGLLDRHPHVSCQGEYHWEEMLGGIFSGQSRSLPLREPESRNFLLQQLQSVVRKSVAFGMPDDIRVIGDRTPHGIEPIILDVPHIVIVRDGRDVLVSRAFHLFNRPDTTGLFELSATMRDSLASFQTDKWFFKTHPELLLTEPEFVRDTIRWWAEHQQRDQAAIEKHPDLPVRFVQYEDLLQDTNSTCDALFNFLGVEPDLAPEIKGHLKPGLKEEQPDKFLRKGQAGDWENYFTEQTKIWFKEIANEELVRLGYAENDQW